MKKIKYSKKAKINIINMAKVETMLRKAGHKKLEEIKYNDGRWYVGEVKKIPFWC